jgi:hypothetical protein
MESLKPKAFRKFDFRSYDKTEEKLEKNLNAQSLDYKDNKNSLLSVDISQNLKLSQEDDISGLESQDYSKRITYSISDYSFEFADEFYKTEAQTEKNKQPNLSIVNTTGPSLNSTTNNLNLTGDSQKKTIERNTKKKCADFFKHFSSCCKRRNRISHN